MATSASATTRGPGRQKSCGVPFEIKFRSVLTAVCSWAGRRTSLGCRPLDLAMLCLMCSKGTTNPRRATMTPKSLRLSSSTAQDPDSPSLGPCTDVISDLEQPTKNHWARPHLLRQPPPSIPVVRRVSVWPSRKGFAAFGLFSTEVLEVLL